MSLLEEVRAARRAHEELRSSPPSAAGLGPKADLYRVVKALLDRAWEATGRTGPAAGAADVRRAVARLTADAEYYAGLSDAEGFRDPEEAWAAYELLERAFAAES